MVDSNRRYSLATVLFSELVLLFFALDFQCGDDPNSVTQNQTHQIGSALHLPA